MIVAGIGCRRTCESGEIVALVERAAGLTGARPAVLAAPAFKSGSQALHTAADRLGVPLRWVAQPDLLAVQSRCPTRSMRAVARVGVASVAEGCALATAGDAGRLVLARIASENASCALAESGA